MNFKILLIPIWGKSPQGDGLFRFLSSEQFTGLEVENTPPPPPGMNRVKQGHDKYNSFLRHPVSTQSRHLVLRNIDFIIVFSSSIGFTYCY